MAIVSLRQIVETAPKELPWLVQGLLLEGGTMELYGSEGMGKSTLIFQMLACLTAQQPFLGMPVSKAGDVLYLQAEMLGSLLSEKARWFAETYPTVLDHLWLPDESGMIMRLAENQTWQEVSDQVKELRPLAVVVDPFSPMLLDGDMNRGASVRQLLTGFDTWRKQTGTAIVIIHHARKGQYDSGRRIDEGQGESTGSNELTRWADTVVKLDGQPIGLPNSQQQLIVQKRRHAPLSYTGLPIRFNDSTMMFEEKATTSLTVDDLVAAVPPDGIKLPWLINQMKEKFGASGHAVTAAMNKAKLEGKIVIAPGGIVNVVS